MASWLFSRWSVRTKVGLAAGLLAGLSLLAAGWPIWQIVHSQSDGEAINQAGKLRMLSQRVLKETVLAADGVEGAESARSEALAQGRAILDGLLGPPHGTLTRSAGARAELRRIGRQWDSLRSQSRAYLNRAGRSPSFAREADLQALRQRSEMILTRADRLTDRLENHIETRLYEAARFSGLLLGGYLLLSVLIVEGLRRLLRPLGTLTQAAEKLGRGAAIDPISAESDDEIGRLARSFNQMARKLERRQRELEQARAHYEQLFEEAPYAITVTHPDGSVLEANDAARSLFGWDPEEEPTADAWSAYEERSERTVFMDRLEAEGEVRDFETRLTDADGTPFLGRISAVRRSDGAEPVYQAIIEDITERRQNQRRLRVFEQALAQTADMILITDEEGTIWYANEAAQTLTGYRQEELIGENPRLLQSGKTDEETYEQLWSALEAGEVFQTTLPDRRKDGSLVYLEQTITPVTIEEQESTHYVSTGRDITDRIRRERQVKILNRILRHDVGNAATHVLGFIDVLGETSDAAQRAEYRSIIRQAGTQIMRLTESARALMQAMQEGGLETAPTDLARIARQEVQTARSLYEGLEISTSGLSDPVWVEGTPLLATLIGNLLHNALRHGDRDPVEVTVDLEITGDRHARLRVADNGPGVPDEKKEVIFGEAEHGLESSGTGMGLYLARQVANQCGGRIWVEDNSPNGAVFITELPRAEQPEPETASEEETQSR